jgi:hypothetical protein
LKWLKSACLIVEVSEIVVRDADEPDVVVDLFDAELWPAKTRLRLIICLLKQMRPQSLVTMLPS